MLEAFNFGEGGIGLFVLGIVHVKRYFKSLRIDRGIISIVLTGIPLERFVNVLTLLMARYWNAETGPTLGIHGTSLLG
jgi:hypothetical protein